MKWEKALKYTRKHKRMIAVMMGGYEADEEID